MAELTRLQMAQRVKNLASEYGAACELSRIGDIEPAWQAFVAAIDALATVEAGSEWISVEDRLPDVSGIDDGEAVLVANRFGSFCAEWHGTGITGFSSHGYDDQFTDVTHWQPLPKPPAITAAPAEGVPSDPYLQTR